MYNISIFKGSFEPLFFLQIVTIDKDVSNRMAEFKANVEKAAEMEMRTVTSYIKYLIVKDLKEKGIK